eukprot:14611031-Alexandrium_andersonii.AAC.1
MSASLVGSEMCIRDRTALQPLLAVQHLARAGNTYWRGSAFGSGVQPSACLLYTSDAADDM